jgi:hypothetical protein
MTTFFAALAGLAAFLITLFGLSMALGLLAEHVQLFRLLRLQPFRGVATWATFSAAVWLGVITFGIIAG